MKRSLLLIFLSMAVVSSIVVAGGESDSGRPRPVIRIPVVTV